MTGEVVQFFLAREKQKSDWLDIHTIAERLEQTTHNADDRVVARTVRETAAGRLRALENGK